MQFAYTVWAFSKKNAGLRLIENSLSTKFRDAGIP
jgi:hypothetical protein